MTQSATPVVSRRSEGLGVRIDAEKLDCYHVAQDMRALIVGVLGVPSALYVVTVLLWLFAT